MIEKITIPVTTKIEYQAGEGGPCFYCGDSCFGECSRMIFSIAGHPYAPIRDIGQCCASCTPVLEEDYA